MNLINFLNPDNLIPSLFVLLAANGIITLLLGIGYYRIRQRLRETAAGNSLRDDVSALYAGAVGIGKRLSRIEHKLRVQEERQEQLELRKGSDKIYEHAIRLAHEGAEMQELIRTCDLTRGEAELIMMLHHGKHANDDAVTEDRRTQSTAAQ